jgi:XisI protein
MDRLTRYREIARQIIEDYTRDKVSHGEIRTEGVIDSNLDHYQVNHVGWDGRRRVHGVVLHFDIIDEKFWVQYDGTDRPVAEELEAAGVPKDDIVLAFHSPETRKLTGYAIG